MSNNVPDLTGLNEDYFVDNYERTIFDNPQKIYFEIPVFNNSNLVITKIGVVNTVLVKGTDYIISADDKHIDAMSICKSIDDDFDKILLKSVTITCFDEDNFKIQASFNQLYIDNLRYATINQDDEEITADVISAMATQISYLQEVVTKVSETAYSNSSSTVKLILDEDPTCSDADNLIIDELHDIDTINGKIYIRPIYGSFFKDTVVLKNDLTDEEFSEDDFEVIDMDTTKTMITSNKSGVFKLIKILKSYVGQVKTTYHAYGGQADVVSIQSIQNQLSIINEYLSNSISLTASSLKSNPIITGLTNKTQELEGTMRLLLKNGIPNYSDVNSGKSLLKKIVATDTSLNWWTIAKLYRVSGSADDAVADVFKFRLKTATSGLMFDCEVAVNVSGTTDSRLSVTCNNSLVPDDTFNTYVPQIRILEVTSDNVYSGVLLQLGLRLGAGILTETLAIEDMSGVESCWLFPEAVDTSVPPENDSLTMPNGTSTYVSGATGAKVNRTVIPFKNGLEMLKNDGVVLNLGDISLDQYGTTYNTANLSNYITVLDFEFATSFEMTVEGGSNGRTYIFNVPINSKNDNGKVWAGHSDVISVNGSVYNETTTAFDKYSIGIIFFYDELAADYKVKIEVASSNTTNILTMNSLKLKY